MKVYSVKRKPQEIHHGVLGVPEAMMGTRPVYVYRDMESSELFMSISSPKELARYASQIVEYIVTIWPRDTDHLSSRFKEIVEWHSRGQND